MEEASRYFILCRMNFRSLNIQGGSNPKHSVMLDNVTTCPIECTEAANNKEKLIWDDMAIPYENFIRLLKLL